VIEWRVTNTSKGGSPRGQVMPYADQRAYTDRLNTLVTPAGWTRRYTVHTSANFERGKDQKIVAKVLVTCELTIFGVGSHSATGEGFTDDANAGTSAEAQAFKRACTCFGLGRYLYYFTGTWVELDDRKRPRTIPKLPDWATPEGWRQGLRPNAEVASRLSEQTTAGNNRNGDGHDSGNWANDRGASLVRDIEQMERSVGKRMYRGLLKTVAQVWNPKDIQDPAIQQKVLAHMQAAERGLRRLDAALDRVGPESLTQILRSLKFQSIDRVDNLQALHEIVLALEGTAQGTTMKQ
jgi:Rad52/22 family double-strand break repair protein